MLLVNPSIWGIKWCKPSLPYMVYRTRVTTKGQEDISVTLHSSPSETFFCKRSRGHIHIIDMAVQLNNDFRKCVPMSDDNGSGIYVMVYIY